MEMTKLKNDPIFLLSPTSELLIIFLVMTKCNYSRYLFYRKLDDFINFYADSK